MTRQNSRHGPDLLELALLGGGLLLAVAFLLPVLVVALPASVALWCLPVRRRWWLVYGLLAALLLLRWHDWRGFLALQEETGTLVLYALVTHEPWHPWPFVAAYARLVWPYALAWGPLLGTGLALGFSLLFSYLSPRSEHQSLRLVSADQLRKHTKTTNEPQPVDGFTARGRLTALTALPKQGKTYAWFGLLKARQQGGQWFGRRVQPGRTCVMTEEDRGTFTSKVFDFGITGKSLVSIHAPETPDAKFGQEAWPALVEEACRLAHKQRCDTLTLDTMTTWAPWAFRGPEAMSFALRTLKQAVGRYKLAGVVILHNRKQQSDLGAIVDMLGTIAGSAAYDVIAGFSREKVSGECRLAVDGRLGEWECTATLLDGRYVPIGDGATSDAALLEPMAPRMAGVLDAYKRAGPAGLTMEGAQGATVLPAATLRRYVLALADSGHLIRRGAGKSGDPHVWRAADLPPPPPTSDPAYTAYLSSPEWATKRAAVLERCDGKCEDCGQAPVPGDTLEVHHLTYERVGAEWLEDLIAVCAADHRRRHAAD